VAVKQALFLPLFVLLSCVRVNVGSDSPDLVIHKLDYGLPNARERALDTVLRVYDFSATDEYDRKAFVLVLGDGTVQRTNLHQWATTPALALPDLLHRDLLAEASFRAVHRRGAVGGEELVIEGFVREFGARESKAEWAAVLDVDLLMRSTGVLQGQKQKTYRLTRVMPSEGYDVLAQTLSSLARDWSQEVRSDIRAFVDARVER
jgi:uncharacterized lipoprotein YmbA